MHQQLIADAGHSPGAFNVVGTFTAGTPLVFYITTTFNNTTYLSTGDHSHIVVDGTEAWNIGWEDFTDFDYDDVVTRICYQEPGTTGCARDVDGTFGPGAPPASPYGPNAFVAYRVEPVNTATGNYTSHVTDLTLPGRGVPFAFGRTYNSLDPNSGDLGTGWTRSLSDRLESIAGGAIAYHASTGARFVYSPDGSGGFARPPGTLDNLSASGGEFDLLRPDQVRLHFDSAGALKSETDRNGNSLNLTYAGRQLTQVTDTVGRVMQLSYFPDGHLSGISGPQSLSVSYAYDGSGRLATVTDARGFDTTYTYDSGGRLATIVDANNHQVVANTYGPTGRVIEQVDARGNHTTFAWDEVTETSTMTDARGGQWVDDYAGGVLVSQRDPLGNLTRYGFNAELQSSSIIDARGYEIDTTFDSASNLATRTFFGPLFAVERYTYDAKNNLLTAQDRRGNTTTRTYDAAGNLKTVTGPSPISPVTTFNYDPAGTGLVFSVIDARGKTTTFGYDAQANLSSVTTPLGFRATMTFDSAGRMLTRVDPRGNVAGANPALFTWAYTYDGAGNVLTTTDPLNHMTTVAFDPAGNKVSVTDANNHITTYAYDEANQLVTLTDPLLKSTLFGYDIVGNQVSMTDANGHLTTSEFDLAHRLTAETRPLSRRWTYEYDPNGNRTKSVDAIGNSTPQAADGTITYSYDAYDRLSGITYSDGTSPVVYTRDLNGNVTNMTDGAQNYRTYDVLNRPTKIGRTDPTIGALEINYTYDNAGNVLTRSPVGGTTVSYAYDDDGRLSSATGFATASFAFDAAGNMLTKTLPAATGYIETRAYDTAGQLLSVQNAKAGTILSKAIYSLDPVGNRLGITTTTGTTTATYDANDRLTQACYTAACTGSDNFRRYTYDDVGNRITEVSAAGTTTYVYDALDELTSSGGVGGNVSYTYDLDGRQTAAGSRAFAFNLPGLLKSTTSGTTTTTYTYDGDGHRMSAATGAQANKTTKFLWDLNRPVPQLIRELDGNGGLVREFQIADRLLAMKPGPNANPYYFLVDGLGSVVNVVSNSGVTQWTYQYHPFGGSRTATKNNNQAPANVMQFAGEYLDATSLYHLRARQYDPASGRFLAADRGEGAAGVTGSDYAYAANNPILRTDPSGRNPCIPAAVAGAEIGGTAGAAFGGVGAAPGAAGGALAGFVLCLGAVAASVIVGGLIIDNLPPAPPPATGTLQEPRPMPPPPKFNPPPGPVNSPECSGNVCRVVLISAAGIATVYIYNRVTSEPIPVAAPPPTTPGASTK